MSTILRAYFNDFTASAARAAPTARTGGAAEPAVPLRRAPVFRRRRAFAQRTQRLPSATLRPVGLSSCLAAAYLVAEDGPHAILCAAPPGVRPAPAPGPLRAAPRPAPGPTAQRRRAAAGTGRAPGPLRRDGQGRLHAGHPAVDLAVAVPQPGALLRRGRHPHLGAAGRPEPAALVGGHRRLLPRPRQAAGGPAAAVGPHGRPPRRGRGRRRLAVARPTRLLTG